MRPIGRRLPVEIVVPVGIVGEHEELVGAIDDPWNLDRAAEGHRGVVRRAILVRAPGARIGVEDRILKLIRRIELVRPGLIVHGAARRIRTGPGHHRDADAGAVTDTRGEVRRLDAHLLQHVRVRRRRHLPADAVVRAPSIDQSTPPTSPSGDCIGRGPADESLAGKWNHASGAHAWREPREQERHVRLHRQLGDLLLVEHQPLPQRRHFDQRRLAGDGNLFGDRADLERRAAGRAADRTPA